MSRLPLLQGWVRRTLQHPLGERLVLRGSLVTAELVKGLSHLQPRDPQDVDHLVLGPFDPGELARLSSEVAELSDPSTHLDLLGTEVIWAETPFPGLRVHLLGWETSGDAVPFQVDLAFGDPLCRPPILMDLSGVGRVPACPPEILVAWKLHGLTEFGRGRWRAKDLYDLHLLVEAVPLDPVVFSAALPLAFTSRGDLLQNLDDFRWRESWGCSFSGQRKWRSFLKKHALSTDFMQARTSVREALQRLEGP